MRETVLYVYAITREPVLPLGEAVDRSRRFAVLAGDELAAVYTLVPRSEFSQEAIDEHGADLAWLGAIGYRHQGVLLELMNATSVIPLRAFSMFSTEAALGDYLADHAAALSSTLGRLGNGREWTLTLAFDAARWSEALTARVPSLQSLEEQIASAGEGKAFLLTRKLDEEKKRAAREAEEEVLREIEAAVTGRLACMSIAESRQQRSGGHPQINVLVERDRETDLEQLRDELIRRYEPDGVDVALTGPWPPYTFAGLTP